MSPFTHLQIDAKEGLWSISEPSKRYELGKREQEKRQKEGVLKEGGGGGHGK